MLNRNKHLQSGFTLVEIIIAVAIIAILAGIAIPQYQEYIARTNRTDAKAALLRLAAAQERFYIQNNAYAKTPTILNIPKTENDYYDLSISTANNDQTYTASADANSNGRQLTIDKDCKKFTINQSGTRAAENSSGTDNTGECW